MVAGPVGLHGHDLAGLLVGSHAHLGPEGRTLTGVLLLLLVVVAQVAGTAGGQHGHADEGFHGGAELVAEGAAGGVLHHDQLFGEFHAQAGGDHQGMQVQADGLGVDHQLALFVQVAVAHVRFDVQVRLTLGVEAVFHHHVFGIVEEGLGVLALFDVGLIVDVGRAGMDLDGVGSHGFGRAHVFGQQFQVELDLVGGGAGMGFAVGADDGQGVTVLEHLGIVEDGTIPAVALVVGKGDEAGDAVFALDVLVGQHADHAGHLFGFGGVDALDDGMGDLGLGQGQVQGVGRHVHGGVGAVFGQTGHLDQGAGTRQARTEGAAVSGQLVAQLFNVLVSAHDGGGVHDGVHQGLVTGAAANIVMFLEPVAHFFTAGGGIGVQQGLGGHDEAGRAEAALGRTVEHPGFLEGMQFGGGAHAFEGGDLGLIGHAAHLDDAGAGDLAVEDHGAGTTLALTATDLDAGDLQLVAQHVNEKSVGIHQDLTGNTIDHKHFRFHMRLLETACKLRRSLPRRLFSKRTDGITAFATAGAEAPVTHAGDILGCHLQSGQKARDYEFEDAGLVIHDTAGQPQYGNATAFRGHIAQQEHGPGIDRCAIAHHLRASGTDGSGGLVVGIHGHAARHHHHVGSLSDEATDG